MLGSTKEREYPFYVAIVDGDLVDTANEATSSDMVVRVESQHVGHEIAWGVQPHYNAELQRLTREELVN